MDFPVASEQVVFRTLQYYNFAVLRTDAYRSGDGPLFAKQRQTMAKSLYLDNWHEKIRVFYEHITLELLHEKSYKIAGINHVDITRE